MFENTVVGIAKEAMYVVLLVSAPILGGSLIVGLIISLLQATTQIQEQTLTFIPKIIVVLVVVVVFGPWMLNILTSYTNNLFASIPSLISFH
ncbi:MAG: flagellar biosynthesis protein FliQ [Chitinophagales bacterium]